MKNVVVHVERQPEAIQELSIHDRKQWGNFWGDNYTAGSTHTITLDSDVVIAAPFLKEALFDSAGRSYFFYFPFDNSWGTDEAHIQPAKRRDIPSVVGKSGVVCGRMVEMVDAQVNGTVQRGQQ